MRQFTQIFLAKTLTNQQTDHKFVNFSSKNNPFEMLWEDWGNDNIWNLIIKKIIFFLTLYRVL